MLNKKLLFSCYRFGIHGTYKGARWIFANPGKQLEVETPKEAPEKFEKVANIKKILDAFGQDKVELPWQKGNTPQEFAKKLAEKLKLNDEEKKTAAMIILHALAEKTDLGILISALDNNNCKTVKLNEGKITFYNDKNQLISENILEDPTVAAEKQGAIALFKKYFPQDKDKIHVLENEKAPDGTKAVIALGKLGEVLFYDTDGKKQRLNYERMGVRSVPVQITSSIVIEAPNTDGIISKYVQVNVLTSGIYQEKLYGYVELGAIKKRDAKYGFKTLEVETTVPSKKEEPEAKTEDIEKKSEPKKEEEKIKSGDTVPATSEKAVPSKKEKEEETFAGRTAKYREKYQKHREKADSELAEKIDEYMKTTYILRPEIVALVNDEEKWKEVWNEEGKKGMTGMDRLIFVLKQPVFREAGLTEENARDKMLELIQKGRNDRVDLADILDVFDIYRDDAGRKGNFSDFKKEFEENKKTMNKNEKSWTAIGGKYKDSKGKFDILKDLADRKKVAKSKGMKSVFDTYQTKEEAAAARDKLLEADKWLAELRNDPDYAGYEAFSHALDRQVYLNNVVTQGGALLEALRHLGIKEFTPDMTPKMQTENMRPIIASLKDVFADSGSTQKVAWEDVLAEEGFKPETLSEFGRRFDRRAPVDSLRMRLHSYLDEKGELDHVERMREDQTVKELNRLMAKGLRRLGVFKGAKALETYQKYANDTDTKDSEKLFDKAFERLKISKLDDFKVGEKAPQEDKELARDRKDLIKMGYIFDERDRELNITPESLKDTGSYAKNPLILFIQKQLVAKGYPSDKKHLKDIETKMLGAGAIKLDLSKGVTGLGAGTGIDLGEGWKIGLGGGIDTASGSPSIGVGIRKGFKTSESTELGFSAGIGSQIPTMAPGLGVGTDFTFPLAGAVDMSLFAGGGVGYLGLSAGGGIMVSGNAERAVADAENAALGIDKTMRKELDKINDETDPEARYKLIEKHPALRQILGPIFSDPDLPEEQKKIIIRDTYNAMRDQLHGEALEQTKTPGVDVPILHQMAKWLGGEFRITGAGVVAGAIAGIPYAGPIFTVEIGRKVLVYPRASAASKMASDLSDSKIQADIKEKLETYYKGSGKEIEMKKTVLGESSDIMLDENGELSVRLKEEKIDLTALTKQKDKPALKEYNEKLKPFLMQFVPDKETGLFELKIDGAIGNLTVMIDPGMEHKGLILRDNRVFLAPGARPELFISREEFRTPFAKKGHPLNTVITISDTPDRTRVEIAKELTTTGAYLYKKANMQWEIMFDEKAKESNVVSFEDYKKSKTWFETFKEEEKGPTFESELFEDYQKNLKELPFIQQGELGAIRPGLVERKDGKKSFAERILEKNELAYREITTVKATDTTEMIAKRMKRLVQRLQESAKDGKKLNNLEVNAVVGKLMDLSFSELKKAGADAKTRHERFKNNLLWAKKAVLIPHFEEKIKAIEDRRNEAQKEKGGMKVFSHSAEQLADYAIASLLAIPEKDFGGDMKGEKFEKGYIFNAVAGSMGVEGMRGLPYYMQTDYGVLGLKERSLGNDKAMERELSILILEMESPLETHLDDKAFMESPLAKKVLAMPGLWFVLGDKLANQAVKRAKSVLTDFKDIAPNEEGWNEFKKIVEGIRKAQLNGANIYTYKNKDGKIYEFHIDTKVASGAHAHCGNPAFAAKESLKIVTETETKEGENLFIVTGNESTATVSPKTKVQRISIGLAGIVTDTSKAKTAPGEKLGKSRIPHPPEKIPPPPPPSPGPGGKGDQFAGTQSGGTEKVSTPPPTIGGGNEEKGP